MESLDIVNRRWDIEELQSGQIKVAPQNGALLILKKIPEQEVSPYKSTLYFGAVGKALFKADDQIGKVAAAMDQVAFQALVAIIKSEKQSLPPNQQAEVLETALQQLENLRHNLSCHDQMIGEHNAMLWTNIILCPSHEKTISALDKEIAKVKAKLLPLAGQLEENFKQLVKAINQHFYDICQNDLPVDRQLIERLYPRIMKYVDALPQSEQEAMGKFVNGLLNTAYLKNLKKMSAGQTQSIPKFIMLLLKGLDEEQMKQVMQSGRHDFFAKICSQEVSEDLAMISPLKLVEKMEEEFLETIQNQLTKFDAESVKLLAGTLYKLELRCRTLVTEAQASAKAVIKSDLDGLYKGRPQSLTIASNIVDAAFTRLELPFARVYLEICKRAKLTPPNLKGSKEEFDRDLYKLHFYLQDTLTKEDLIYFMTAVMVASVENRVGLQEAESWLSANEAARVFEFSQGEAGDVEALGAGVCAAVNCRWIRHLLKYPEQEIHSVADLMESPNMSGITAKDRMNQAKYQMANRLKDPYLNRVDPLSFMASEELVGDVQETLFTTIGALIDECFKKAGPGIFGIAALGSAGGHAVGMQMEPSKGIYRFWDVNIGFYQYQTLDEMKKAFSEYMDAIYFRPNNFDKFIATRYTLR